MKTETLFQEVSLEDVAQQPERIIEEFHAYIGKRKIILYGAALIGQVLYQCLRVRRFEVAYIVDRDAARIGNVDGVPVQTPDILRDLVAEAKEYAIIFAVSERTARAVTEKLAKWNLPFTAVINGQKLTDCLRCALCAANHKRGEDVSHAYCGDCSILDSICPVLRQRAVDETNSAPDAAKSKRTVTIGYLLGNTCTINCRFCFESVPLYGKEERHFVETAHVIRDIQRVASVSECITFVEFIGGEPFLHKGLPEIIRECLTIPNIAYVHVFTNGTVEPSAELLAALAQPRASVYVSNYTGFLTAVQAAQVKETKTALAAHGILHLYGGEKKWFDMSSYGRREETRQELEARYAACQTHHCNRLHDGVLYVCPHHYAGAKLGKFEERDTVPIHELSEAQLVMALEEFKQLPYAEACRYCDMPHNAPIIMAGD